MSRANRETRQREAIRKVLDEAQKPLHPREIHQRSTKHVSTLGLATTYRNLNKLADEGLAEIVLLPGRTRCYTKPRDERQPLLFCKETQRVEVLNKADIKLEVPKLPKDFMLDGYEIIFHGRFKENSNSAD